MGSEHRGIPKVERVEAKTERYLNPNSPRFTRLRTFLVETDLSRDEIAGRLGISVKSVKQYCNDLYKLEGARRGRISLMSQELKRRQIA